MTQRLGRSWWVAIMLAFALVAGACSSDDADDGGRSGAEDGNGTELSIEVGDEETTEAGFEIRPGTEEVTVTGVEQDQRLSLVNEDGERLVILRADKFGQAHFAYVGNELTEFQTGDRAALPTADGYTVEPGKGYTIRNEDTSPVEVSEPFEILGRDDHPEPSFFDESADSLVPDGDETSYYGYVTTRDGVQLSVNVRLPGPASDGPYPTVIEYSGYGPSNPDAVEPGSMIAGLLGYATVGVNMRGTGCSGGVFDVFNTAQQVDGYDVVETIARQPWVLHNEVGMVGLSYSGITQLYVAATQPPSLAAVTPLSVIKDPWLQQWPGGVYNGGFTREWLNERENQSAAGGTNWVSERVEGGDDVCESHIELREQNMDFEAFGRSLVNRPVHADARDLSKLIDQIEVPVYLTGAWQDEQTGPQFADMLGNFDNAPVTRFTMFNGRHPDGYTPELLSRWHEFLELYVARRVPRIDDGIRAAAPDVFAGEFGVAMGFADDRFADFADDDVEGVLAAYEAEPDVRILFGMGVGHEVVGAPSPLFEQTYETWPPTETEERVFHFAGEGTLSDEEPSGEGVDRYLNDPESGPIKFFGEEGYELMGLLWDFDWTEFDDGDAVSYATAPFDSDVVLGGPSHVDLHVRVPDGDADVQVTLTRITSDVEWHVTTGLLRLSDRAVSDDLSSGRLIDRTFHVDDSAPMPDGDFALAQVSLPSFAEVFRAGDRLRITVSSPGRDFGAWSFETQGDDGTPRDIGWGGATPSRFVVGVLPIDGEIPAQDAPCPSLRGQACRSYTARTNEPAD